MARETKRSAKAVLALAVSLATGLYAGCTGTITEPGARDGEVGPGGKPSSKGQDDVAPVARVSRLTHQQWRNSVRDLLGIPASTPIEVELPQDPKTAGYLFDNDAQSLSVDQALWGAYQRAADAVVELVVGDAALFAKLLPPDPGDPDQRARALIDQLGGRAYRRPLQQAEKDELFEVYQGAPALFTGVPAFEAGVRLVLQALLQSPFFLYRIESSTKVVNGVVPLNGYEMASRLSYTLLDTMPDAKLFAAAAAGELSSAAGVEAQARRLLDDPRAADVIASFHHALFDGDKIESIKPLPALFPGVSTELAAAALEENERFVRDQFSQGGGFRELLTATTTFVNADLAGIYGLSGSFGPSFQKVELDPEQRRGIFTQIGFLAANATSADPDPIHRGAYLARRIVCLPVSAPPEAVEPLPAAAAGTTNRENVVAYTEKEGSVCAGCHKDHINPFGFAFESYDAVGAWREQDNGHPVDSSASPLIDEIPTSVSGAVELAEKLAASPGAHECYAKHWLEYAFGRKRAAGDEKTIRDVGELSRSGGSIKDVIAKLTVSRAFMNRSKEELP